MNDSEFSLKERFSAVYKKYERWVPIIFFLLGFLFDALIISRPDELHVIIQQAVYILICAILIRVELLEKIREVRIPWGLTKVWKYREALLHFLMGTLLNCYTIFYFKSASAVTSFAFIGLLISLLVINEFKHFGESQTKVHVALWSLCLVSYCTSLLPILLGFIGTLAFLISAIVAILVFWGFYRVLLKDFGEHPGKLRSFVVLPYAGIHTVFALLYFAHAIPPVPLSVEYMGIFHGVKKESGEYQLSYTRPRWKFWQHGDQTFFARPGDAVFCFAQIFSPSGFNDKLQVRWLFKDERRGWIAQDAIPLPISGGREEGYRAFTKKENYQPGVWRIQVETLEGHEVGRIGFTIVTDDNAEERVVQTITR